MVAVLTLALTAAQTKAFAEDAKSDYLEALPSIHGFRVSHQRNLTRLVLALNGPIRFRAFTVDGPYRLVVDMQPVNWKLAKAMPLATNSILKSLSFKHAALEEENPIARLVAVMRRPARVQKSFALRPKGKARDWRLVVDLEPISKDEFDRLKRSQRDRAPGDDSFGPATGETARVHLAAARNSRQRRYVIVLDPGHGGIDKGASSPWGLKEKEVVLSTARYLRQFLNRNRRFKVLMTRNRDVYIPLRERYEFARRNRASLFISIHADANPITRMRGLSVHTLSSRASDKLAGKLAERENRSDAVAGINLRGASKSVSNILLDLVRRETRVGSARISTLIIRSARNRVRLLRKPQRSAGFVVLKAPDVPSVLVELGFLTNSKDERLLRTKRYRKRMAAILARAVTRYFSDRRYRPSRSRQNADAIGN